MGSQLCSTPERDDVLTQQLGQQPPGFGPSRNFHRVLASRCTLILPIKLNSHYGTVSIGGCRSGSTHHEPEPLLVSQSFSSKSLVPRRQRSREGEQWPHGDRLCRALIHRRYRPNASDPGYCDESSCGCEHHHHRRAAPGEAELTAVDRVAAEHRRLGGAVDDLSKELFAKWKEMNTPTPSK